GELLDAAEGKRDIFQLQNDVADAARGHAMTIRRSSQRSSASLLRTSSSPDFESPCHTRTLAADTANDAAGRYRIAFWGFPVHRSSPYAWEDLAAAQKNVGTVPAMTVGMSAHAYARRCSPAGETIVRNPEGHDGERNHWS